MQGLGERLWRFRCIRRRKVGEVPEELKIWYLKLWYVQKLFLKWYHLISIVQKSSRLGIEIAVVAGTLAAG